MKPKELHQEHNDLGILQADGVEGYVLHYRGHKLMVNIKCQLKVSELSTASNRDLLASLAIAGPKVLHEFHNLHALCHLPDPTHLPSNHSASNIQKNWESNKMPARVCLKKKFSSSNFSLDRSVTSDVMVCEVTILKHKSCNNSVKARNTKTKFFLSSAVSGALWMAQRCSSRAGQWWSCQRNGRIDYTGSWWFWVVLESAKPYKSIVFL